MSFRISIPVVAASWVLGAFAGCSAAPPAMPLRAGEIPGAVRKAENFIATTQDEYGEFRSTACDSSRRCYADSTPFITAFVLSSLQGLPESEMRKRGLTFLRNEMLPGGLWRFWTFRAPPWTPILQPDLDDTVTVADQLQSAGMLDVDNRAIILRNTDSRGRFLTWLLPTEHTLAFDFDPASRLLNELPRPSARDRFGYNDRLFNWIRRNEFPNETDSAVNANVLLYLKMEISPVCEYLNATIENDEPSVYYLGRPALYYIYGRAYRGGVSCLEPSRERIVAKLLAMQGSDGAFGTVQNTALALNALQDFHYHGDALAAAANYLLTSQKPDGSWEEDFFFKESAFCKDCHYWRSAALTSSFAVEALLKALP